MFLQWIEVKKNLKQNTKTEIIQVFIHTFLRMSKTTSDYCDSENRSQKQKCSSDIYFNFISIPISNIYNMPIYLNCYEMNPIRTENWRFEGRLLDCKPLRDSKWPSEAVERQLRRKREMEIERRLWLISYIYRLRQWTLCTRILISMLFYPQKIKWKLKKLSPPKTVFYLLHYLKINSTVTLLFDLYNQSINQILL